MEGDTVAFRTLRPVGKSFPFMNSNPEGIVLMLSDLIINDDSESLGDLIIHLCGEFTSVVEFTVVGTFSLPVQLKSTATPPPHLLTQVSLGETVTTTETKENMVATYMYDMQSYLYTDRTSFFTSTCINANRQPGMCPGFFCLTHIHVS